MPAAAQISVMDTPLDHAHDEAMPLVEWAHTPWGIVGPKRVCQHDSIHYPLRGSLLRDRDALGVVTEANKELFHTPRGGVTLKVDSQSSDKGITRITPGPSSDRGSTESVMT